jgi:hypothetical protein
MFALFGAARQVNGGSSIQLAIVAGLPTANHVNARITALHVAMARLGISRRYAAQRASAP